MLLISTFLCVLFVVPLASSYHEKVESEAIRRVFQQSAKDNSLIPRIIGGTVVTPHAYPFHASVQAVQKTQGETLQTYFCGGTLISSQWVLTAARCVDMKPNYIYVLLGVHDLSDVLNDDNIQIYNTTRYKIHEGFNSETYVNDVGLIRLPLEATLNSYVNVVELAKGADTYVGKDATALGWGVTETGEMAPLLTEVTVKIMSNSICSNELTNITNLIKLRGIESTHVCTTGEGRTKGICEGDSGGPLLVDGIQVGIAFVTNVNCTTGLPSVYTRVTDYYDWILTHAKDGAANSLEGVRFTAIVAVTLCFMSLFKLM